MTSRDNWQLRWINPLVASDWDASLASYPNATIFHGASWCRVLHETYRFAPVYLLARGPTGHHGILPLMEVKSWATRRRAVSLPFTDECGTLCTTPEVGEFLRSAVDVEAARRRWRTVEYRGGSSDTAQPSVCYYGHDLPLQADSQTLFGRFDSATRRAIRRAEQSGLDIEISHDLRATRTFHQLLCKTRRRHGLPPQPLKFFDNIQKYILAQRGGCVVLARHGATPIAGAVFLQLGKRVVYKYGASDFTHQHLRANNLVMWRAIELFAQSGADSLDFGRTSLANDGLRRFKLAWGTRERVIKYFKYDCRNRQLIVDDDRSAGWHNRVFKVLPTFISKVIGSATYKHIA